MADDNKPMKYLRYAIGEIVLVVIGILIALQVNNWNNQIAQDHQTNAIFNQIIDELIIDVKMIQSVNGYYVFKDSLITAYHNANLTEMKRKSNAEIDENDLVDMIRTFAPMEIHDRGFNLLMNHTDQLDERFKPYIDELIYLYQDVRPMIDMYNDRLVELLHEHRMHKIKNHAWYSREKGLIRKQAEYDYYKYDPIYKNYVEFYDEMILNALIHQRLFEDKAIKFSRKINSVFKLNRNIDAQLSFVHPANDVLTTIQGTYLDRKNDTLTFLIKDNQLYESTYDNKELIYALEAKIKVGELRYFGDSLFFRNARENLVLNTDGSVSIYHVVSNYTDHLKRVKND